MELNDILNIFYKNNSSKVQEFGRIYPKILYELSKKKMVTVLEIGQRRGETFKSLLDIFENGIIYGIDIGEGSYKKNMVKQKLEKYGKGRAKLFIGDQSDEDLLINIGEEVKKKYGGFDLVIDDGSHMVEHQKKTFEVLSDYMKSNGKYVIEDIETSYYNEFNGGINKKGTFIENLKNLIDVINRDYIKDKKLNTSSPRRGNGNYSFIRNDNKILSMEIYTNCAILNFGYDEELKIVNIHTLSNYEEKLKALIENNRNGKKIQRCCKKIQDKISALHKIMTENEIISALNLMEKCLKLRREIEDVPKYIKKE